MKPARHIPLEPRPISWKPELVPDGKGKFKVPGVPIFCIHNNRGWECDDQWMYKCVENQKAAKSKGFLPRLTVGHNPESPDAAEKPNSGFLDNFTYDATTGYLLADYMDVSPELADELKGNKWPGRSVEVKVMDAEIPVVALLGGTPPFLKNLPDLKFSDKGKGAAKVLYYMDDPAAVAIDPNDTMEEEGEDLNHPALQSLSDVERSDFQKFSRLLELYMEVNGSDGAEMESDEPGEGEGEEVPDTDDEDEELEMNKATELTQKYNDLQQSHADLRDQNAALQLKVETGEWTKKYSEIRAPQGMLNVDEEVKFTLELPQDKRQPYFDRVVKRFERFGPKPADKGGSASDGVVGNTGNGNDWEQVVAYAEANRDKYHGDLLRAARDYRTEQRKAGNGKQQQNA